MNNESNKTIKTSESGINLVVLVQAAFIILKAAGITNIAKWSWFKVFLPSIILSGIILIIIIIVMIYLIIRKRKVG